MSNLRSRERYAERAWDWEPLNGCFGGTRIRVSDLDGIVERNGRFLVIEAKPINYRISGGQAMLFSRLAALPDLAFHVLVLYGEPPFDVEAMQIWPRDPKAATVADVQDFVSRWFAWADQQTPPTKGAPHA